MIFDTPYYAVASRYAYYITILEKLGTFPVVTTVKIEDLGIPSGMLHKAYAEMKEMKFEGKIIDYLCFVSSSYIIMSSLIFLASENKDMSECNSFSTLISKIQYIRNIRSPFRSVNKEPNNLFYKEVNNLIRLAYNRPNIVLDLCSEFSCLPKISSKEELIKDLHKNIEELLIKDTPANKLETKSKTTKTTKKQ